MGVYLNGVKVSVIMYADDLVLISKTKHGLQIGMNALYEFCSANTLTVNTNKSEVMYVSKRKPASLPVIHYNNIPLKDYNSIVYMYNYNHCILMNHSLVITQYAMHVL